MKKKLLERINNPAARFFARIVNLAWIMGGRKGRTDAEQREAAFQRLKGRKYPPGQWHRWYKENRRRQRQQTALKQCGGFKIPPNATGMQRWMVP